jgi:hypothetical protein
MSSQSSIRNVLAIPAAEQRALVEFACADRVMMPASRLILFFLLGHIGTTPWFVVPHTDIVDACGSYSDDCERALHELVECGYVLRKGVSYFRLPNHHGACGNVVNLRPEDAAGR